MAGRYGLAAVRARISCWWSSGGRPLVEDRLEPRGLALLLRGQSLPRDAQDGKTGIEEGGIALAVCFERVLVELAAVQLHDQPLLSEEDVDLIAGDDLVRLGGREAVAGGEREERVLELGAGRAAGVLDEGLEPSGGAAGGAGEELCQVGE